MQVTELFTRWEFILNSLVVALLVQALKMSAVAYYPKDPEAQKKAKALLALLSLALGMLCGVLLQYTPSVGQNAMIGIIAGAFSTQVYTMVQRYLPEGWASEPKKRQSGELPPPPPPEYEKSTKSPPLASTEDPPEAKKED